MTSQPTVVVGGTVSGNVGSCQVNTSDIPVNWNTARSIAVNSCTGEVVGDYTHLDFFSVVIGTILIGFGLMVALGLTIAMFHRD